MKKAYTLISLIVFLSSITNGLYGQLVLVHSYTSEGNELTIKAHKIHGDLYIQTWNDQNVEQYITIPAEEVEENFQIMREFMLDCITWESDGAFYKGDVYNSSGVFYEDGKQVLDTNLDWSLNFLSTDVKGEYIIKLSHDPMNGNGKTSPRGEITFKYSPTGDFKDFILATSPSSIKIAQAKGE